MDTRHLSSELPWVSCTLEGLFKRVCLDLMLKNSTGQPSFNEYFHLLTSSNGTDLISTMNGLFYAGGVIGALVLPTAADKLGRKWAIGIVSKLIMISNGRLIINQSAALCMVSGAVMAGSTHVAEFIAFRFVAGAGAAMMLSAIPVCCLSH
jgi:MFS family permease